MTPLKMAVLGRGAMGSTAEAALASRSYKVLAFGQYWRGHNQGSSHAGTRAPAQAQDDNLIVGPHPNASSIIVAAGFGSHGFTFVPASGEILADLTLDGSTKRDISLFSPMRFKHKVAGKERIR